MEFLGWGVAIAGGAVGLTIGATMDPVGKILANLPVANLSVGGFKIFPLLIGAALILFGWHKVRTDGNAMHFIGGLAIGYGLFLTFTALGIPNPIAGLVSQ